MTCPQCRSPNRPGAQRCKQCREALPPSCIGCGAPTPPDVELCPRCRTERVPAALGARDSSAPGGADADTAPAPPSTPPPSEPRFVGRRGGLDRIRQLLSASAGQRKPTFLVITGAPGIGKTRFAREVLRVLSEDGARVLAASCATSGSTPYAPVARLLRDRFAIADGEPRRSARKRLAAGVAERIPAARATEVTHLLGELCACPFPDSPIVEPLSETAQLETRMFIAARRFFAADAERGPVVLLLDDAERATPETVNLLHYLAAGLPGAPVTIVTVARPSLYEAHPGFGDGEFATERLDLEPLPPDEAVALLGELLRGAGPPAAELAEHVREHLGGVPRAVVELVRYLDEADAFADHGRRGRSIDRARLRALQPLPRTHEELLALRLRGLPPGERDLLEKASACGEVFWLDAVVALVRAAALERSDPDGPSLGEIAAAGDRTRASVGQTLSRLVGRDLLVECSSSTIPGEKEYRFSYPPIWDVVYEGLNEDNRRRYHRLLAQWLELRPEGRGEENQEEVARHLERAGDGDGAAARYRRAADGARARYYNDKAIRLFGQALACLGEGNLAARIHLWHDLGSVYMLKGEYEPALASFERMLRLGWVVASRTKGAVAFNKMGRVWRQKGDLNLALEYLERGLELFQQASDDRGVAGSLDDIGQVLWLLGRYDEALDRSAAALEKRRRLGDKRSIALSLSRVGNIEQARGLFDAAEACYREALELHRQVNDRQGVCTTLNNLAVVRYERGDLEGARGKWEQALGIAEQIGALPLQAWMLNNIGEAAIGLGKAPEARQRLDDALAIAQDLEDRRLMSEAERNLGLLDLEAGDALGARARCTRALELAEATGLRDLVGRALLALGSCAAATLFADDSTGSARHGEAEAFFRRGVELFREIGNEAELGKGLLRFGRFKVERGEVGPGRTLLEEAQAIFGRLGMKAGLEVTRLVKDLA